MPPLRSALSAVIACLTFGTAGAQELSLLSRGLSVRAGYGTYAVHDEAISQEKYSGPMPTVTVNWTDLGESHGHRLLLDFGWSNRIKNNTISAEVLEGMIRFDLVYPLGRFDLFGSPVHAFLGPSLGFFVTQRNEHIAGSSDVEARVSSGTSFGSLSAAGQLTWSLSSALAIDLSAEVTVLSLVGKNQGVKKNESQFELLTPIDAFRGDLDLMLRYQLLGGLSCMAGYEGRLVRIDEWDYFMSGRDLFVFGLVVDL